MSSGPSGRGGGYGYGTTGGSKPTPGQTPPIQTQYGGATKIGGLNGWNTAGTNMYAGGNPNFSETIPPATKQPPIQPPPGGWGDYGGGAGATTTPSYSNVNSGMDGSYYTAPTNTAGQGSPLTMNANGIAPPANTAQGMPGGLGGMQGGLFGGGNFLGGHQPGRPQPGTYGRPSNPNRAPMTNPNPAVGQDWASVLDSGNADALYNMYIKGGYSPEWIQQQINANTYDTAGNPIAGQGYDLNNPNNPWANNATIDALRAKRIAALQALQQRLPPTT
jgi:hypothetical protein